ncbi:MAG: hypothetical protein JNK79_04140 [Chitinophagaceae bacterium]|nr:hypothetical protein [Chitinophagaceae bacterium]
MAILRKILLALLSGFIILLVNWKYQNFDYTLGLEDAFFKKIFLIKDKVYSPQPKNKPHLVYINTGKDLALVEDSIEYGNIAVSDRTKICEFLKFINNVNGKPLYTVLDIQFYYPYTIDLKVDSVMQTELDRNSNIIIPILKNGNGDYVKPLYNTNYGYSDYRTFGTAVNKFRIMNRQQVKSIPIILHEKINGAKYEDNMLFPTCNDSLCLSAIWPSYFIKDGDLPKSTAADDVEAIATRKVRTNRNGIPTEYYNLGELLFDMEASPEHYVSAFMNKILFVGNFDEDVHVTPIGKVTGPVILSDIYLSLLNGQHMVNIWMIVIVLLVFSALSYVAWFHKMPEIRWNFKFLFSSYLTKFMKGYISYFGAMFGLSLLVLILFNVQVALFLPSLIFTGIEYVKEKKYKDFTK